MAVGRLDEASQLFAEALRIKPDFEESSNNLKRILAKQGKNGQ
jgi:hypothetical protein